MNYVSIVYVFINIYLSILGFVIKIRKGKVRFTEDYIKRSHFKNNKTELCFREKTLFLEIYNEKVLHRDIKYITLL